MRGDIEGLRAIAVLAVVLNHMASNNLRGGFVGVDVFFVISGYLIGMHLLQDLEAARFSFLRFYARRARRLFPALVAMLLVVWGFGWVIFTVPEFVDLGKHTVAAALFVSNVLLWSQSGYFAAPSNLKPLLHLWSLGVEEQFYLLVPLLLWLGWDGRFISIRWVLRLSIISLILTVAYPVASFYLLDTRFWELGVGVALGYLSLHGLPPEKSDQSRPRKHDIEPAIFAVLLLTTAILAYSAMAHPWDKSVALASGALVLLSSFAVVFLLKAGIHPQPVLLAQVAGAVRPHQRKWREAGSFAGALLVVLCICAVSSTGWPGPQTIFPVLGTAMVIGAGPSALINRLLAYRPLVFIGGISYPLYLWHWPAIVFWRILNFDASSVNSVVPVLSAFILACLTKVLIEDPVRFGRLGAWKRSTPALRWVVVPLLIAGAVGVSTVLSGGYPARLPESLRAIANLTMPAGETDWRPEQCFFDPGETAAFAPVCTPAKQPGVSQILLWGDSHAAHLYPGLSDLKIKHEFNIVQWTAAACPPTRIYLEGEDRVCGERRVRALEDFAIAAPDTVLLSADWQRYLAKDGSEKALIAALTDVIRWLQQNDIRHIVLFGPGPTWINSESGELFVYMLRKRLVQIPERMGRISDVTRHLNVSMAALAVVWQIDYVSVIDDFCNATGCLVAGNRNQTPPDLLFRDQDHLTPSGSRLLVEAAAAQILGQR